MKEHDILTYHLATYTGSIKYGISSVSERSEFVVTSKRNESILVVTSGILGMIMALLKDIPVVIVMIKVEVL